MTDVNVKERNIGGRVLASEFYGSVNAVEIIDENFKVLRTLSPDHKNVIDVSQPSMGLIWGVPKCIFFEKPEEEVSKRGGHFSAHSCAVDLKVVAIIKSEVIHGENHADA